MITSLILEYTKYKPHLKVLELYFVGGIGHIMEVESLTDINIHVGDGFIVKRDTIIRPRVEIRTLESNDGFDDLKPVYRHPVKCPLGLKNYDKEIKLQKGDLLYKICDFCEKNIVWQHFKGFDFCSDQCILTYKQEIKKQYISELTNDISNCVRQIDHYKRRKEEKTKELNNFLSKD